MQASNKPWSIEALATPSPVLTVQAADTQEPGPDTTAADFCVAVDGKDSNPGTVAAPFATLTAARDAVRKKVAAGLTKDILVLIRGGTYPQTETVTFGPEDSGTEECSITYAAWPGEKVVLSGGRVITGWKQVPSEAEGKGKGEIWTAELPEVKAGQRSSPNGPWYFRQLFVNGRRAIRARTPNADDQTPWWKIETSTAKNEPPPEDMPITVSVTGPIKAYNNLSDVELVFLWNNEGHRKRLGTVNEQEQTFTLPPPHHSIPKIFENDWSLSVPTAGKACYLENALEILDQPGEWYLDRQTGVLSYWPRPGEDLTRDEVVAPVVQKTLLAVTGTHERPVVNLHFKGLHVEYVDWPLPARGYSGMFGCLLVIGQEKPFHRWMEAAVEYSYARSCSFLDGGIAHAGGMGLCLRNGTAYNVIEGNEICDLGGGGIGVGGLRNRSTLQWVAPPEQDEYQGYRIANNYVHHCGTDFYGAVGIFLAMAQGAVVAHNLIHDISYAGIVVGGNEDNNLPFARNNTVEYNHIYAVMKVAVDGAGIYASFFHADRGCLIRGNLIHDVRHNPVARLDGVFCFGIYLDGVDFRFITKDYRFENNVVYRNAGVPLFLWKCRKQDNAWLDNLFQKEGTLPQEFIEAVQARAGLEPAYRQSILKAASEPCNYYPLTGPQPIRAASHSAGNTGWAAYQFDRPQTGQGVVEVFRRAEGNEDSVRLKLRDLDTSAWYEMKGYVGTLARGDEHFYAETSGNKELNRQFLDNIGDVLLLSEVLPLPLSDVIPVAVDGKTGMSGRELIEQGLPVKLAGSPQVVWIVYRRVK